MIRSEGVEMKESRELQGQRELIVITHQSSSSLSSPSSSPNPRVTDRSTRRARSLIEGEEHKGEEEEEDLDRFTPESAEALFTDWEEADRRSSRRTDAGIDTDHCRQGSSWGNVAGDDRTAGGITARLRPLYVDCSPGTITAGIEGVEGRGQGKRLFCVVFDAEGYTCPDITARVTARRVLILRAERHLTSGEGRQSATTFCRRIKLPDDVDADRLMCFLEAGKIVVEAPTLTVPEARVVPGSVPSTRTWNKTGTDAGTTLISTFKPALIAGAVIGTVSRRMSGTAVTGTLTGTSTRKEIEPVSFEDVQRTSHLLSLGLLEPQKVSVEPRIHTHAATTDSLEPMNVVTIRSDDTSGSRLLVLPVELGSLFGPDDVLVTLRNKSKLIITADRHEETPGVSRLSASVTREFDLPCSIDPQTISVTIRTTEGVLLITAAVLPLSSNND